MNTAYESFARGSRMLPLLLAALLGLVAAPLSWAQEPDPAMPELRSLLDRFLAAADDPAMHQRFWDDALVYTSSSGARFGKADILAGMQADATGEPSVRYRAEDVQVMNFGDLAVVTFRLVGETAGSEDAPAQIDEYFNTGTFRRTDGAWQAVAWQATRIPDDG